MVTSLVGATPLVQMAGWVHFFRQPPPQRPSTIVPQDMVKVRRDLAGRADPLRVLLELGEPLARIPESSRG